MEIIICLVILAINHLISIISLSEAHRPYHLKVLSILFLSLSGIYWQELFDWGLEDWLHGTIYELVLFLSITQWDLVILMIIRFFSKEFSPEYNDINSHAFIIVTHNSREIIGNTIKSLPAKGRIVIADNGSKPEQRLTHLENLRIKVLTLPVGNKTLAQWEGVKWLETHEPNIKIITLIDDDVILPSNWRVVKLTNEDCVGYLLRGCGPEYFAIVGFQDLEYQISSRYHQLLTRFGSNIFASGAISTWKIESLTECLLDHSTAFIGEDYQLGLIAQKKGMNVGILSYEIGTEVPRCWFHCGHSECPCEQPSLTKQRLFCWDVGRTRLYPLVFSVIRSSRWLVKILLIYDIISWLFDWVILGYLLYLTYIGYYRILIRASIMNWALISTILIWGFPIYSEVAMWFTIIYKPWSWVIRLLSAVYVLTWQWWKFPTPQTIRQRLLSLNEILTTWV